MTQAPTGTVETGSGDVVRVEARGHVLVVTLARPASRNAVDGAMARSLEAAIDCLEGDPDLRVGVLVADTAGQSRPVFCAGADLTVVGEGRLSDLFTERGGFAGYAYRERVKPVIVAVDGLATGGGCELVLASDLVVASRRSAFGLAEVRRSLVAAAGGLYRLPQMVGRAVALEAILTGQPLTAERAHAVGLVNRLVGDGETLDAALALADQVARAAPVAVQQSRRVALAAQDATEAELRRLTDDAARVVRKSADAREGVAAFLEKREPVWTGL